MNHPRSMPRFKRRMRIRYRDDGGDKEMVALTRDVSPSGLGVNANRPAPLGALLQLSLEVSDDETIPLTGRVVWVRRVPAGMLAVEVFVDSVRDLLGQSQGTLTTPIAITLATKVDSSSIPVSHTFAPGSSNIRTTR